MCHEYQSKCFQIEIIDREILALYPSAICFLSVTQHTLRYALCVTTCRYAIQDFFTSNQILCEMEDYAKLYLICQEIKKHG